MLIYLQQFGVGRGEVIQAWDLAIPLIAIGQRAVITAVHQFAYGAGGVGPIPPMATLTFDVELLEICDAPRMKSDNRVVVDVSLAGRLAESLRLAQEVNATKRRNEVDRRNLEIDGMDFEMLRSELKRCEAYILHTCAMPGMDLFRWLIPFGYPVRYPGLTCIRDTRSIRSLHRPAILEVCHA